MGIAVDTSRHEIEVAESEEIHSKEMETQNKSALALVRRLLRDSTTFSMDVRSTHGSTLVAPVAQ